MYNMCKFEGGFNLWNTKHNVGTVFIMIFKEIITKGIALNTVVITIQGILVHTKSQENLAVVHVILQQLYVILWEKMITVMF